ncbi:MAG TPA: sensor histidine kinase [Steroidobacteraceae bacterium]|jgi:two-component system sensor histidine kinase DesK|nr:sensor histidine kinase [Steroidobacteraceae bacterium]
MRLKRLLQNIRHPKPNSMVGFMIGADGRVMRNMPFVILFNMAWLFFYPLLAHQSFLHVILPTLIALPLFVYLHLCTYFYDGPSTIRLRYIAAVFLLGFALTLFNLAALGFLIFGFFSIAFCVPTRTAWKVIGTVILVYIIEMILLGNESTTVLSCALPAVLLGISAVYTAYTHQQQAHLRRSTAEIMRLATMAERERIGRDLHDLLGHTLSVVALKSELARKLIDRDLDAARTEIQEVERVARDALSQVRNAVSGIRCTALTAELIAATALLEAQGVRVKCETEHVKLPRDRETALALSLREATTNIRRHAAASGVTIRLRQEQAQVVMEVLDNGRGGRIVPGNGLSGMRERLGNVGGTLALEPNKDGGLRLSVSVPCAA